MLTINTYLAKPNEDYNVHVEKVVSQAKRFLNYYPHFPSLISSLTGVSSERVLCRSLLLAVFHDIGKLIDYFQIAMAQESYRPGSFDFSSAPYYRHEIVSAHFLDRLLKSNFLSGEEPFSSADILAILGHHKDIDTEYSSFRRETLAESQGQEVPYNLPFLKRACEESLSLLDGCIGTPTFDFSLSHSPLSSLMTSMSLNGEIEPLREATRYYFVAVKGLLKVSDWLGSSGEMFPLRLPVSRHREKKTRNKLLYARRSRKRLHESVQWAREMLRSDPGRGKIIYLLPPGRLTTWVSSYLKERLGEDLVGKSPAMSGITVGDRSLDVIRGTEILDKNFFRPVTVAAADQLILSSLNVGHWTLKEVSALLSVIVVDEIPAETPAVFGLWLSMVKKFTRAGVRFLIQSSSPHLLSIVKKEVPELEESYPVEGDITINPLSFDDLSGFIRTKLAKKKRVLVVARSIESAQTMARNLRRFSPICLHERYILSEQQRIIEDIDGSHLVIATESISSSYVVPFDAVVTETGSVESLVYLSRTKEVYSLNPTREVVEEDYLEAFKKSEHLFESALAENRALFDTSLDSSNFVREIIELPGFCQVQVTPKKFEQRVLKLGQALSDFEVKVPFSYAERRGSWKRFRNRYVFTCNMRYLDFYGAYLND